MERIGIIQLSDLQFGTKHIFGNPSTISRKLGFDIQSLAEKHRFTPAYLVISGDITETGAAQEYEEAYKQLNSIRQELSIDHDAMLYVPGNHDISWKHYILGKELDDEALKYRNFHQFEHRFSKSWNFEFSRNYPVCVDHRLGILFVLLNSCERETNEYHRGYVDPSKLASTLLEYDTHPFDSYCRISVLHHRIDNVAGDEKSYLENASEINAILRSHKFNIILSGHMHQSLIRQELLEGHSIIYAGTGSSAVDHTQRNDGTQNQYSIHIIDTRAKLFESHWRAYNPNSINKFGKGSWVSDNTHEQNPLVFQVPSIKEAYSVKEDVYLDANLVNKLRIRSNPFTYSNAEKINTSLILDLFVENKARHQSALRMVGDAIIRGRRGSGKTMLLRYLKILGSLQFDEAIRAHKAAESLPVMINLSRIHSSEWKSSIVNVISAADRLIYDSVLEAIEEKRNQLHLPSFDRAFFDLNQKLQMLKNKEGSLISKMGIAVHESFSHFFKHLLLLIDEVAPVFPADFFSNQDTGFVGWMNSIRNSGPYNTRIAVYPNDVADILNEDRFGTVVNLDYSVRTDEDYHAFREYCISLVDKYLRRVSIDIKDPIKIEHIIRLTKDSTDPLEQIIYTSDGSSRRFLSLIDKCVSKIVNKASPLQSPLEKQQVIEVINDFAGNLLVGYSTSSQELAKSVAKACKKQVTFRFRFPGYSNVLASLFASREELNIVKVVESGTGQRGTTYEFTYPYCVYMDVQTHYLKETRKVCTERDRINGEWIATITTIQRDQLDFLKNEERKSGKITEIDKDVAIILSDSKEYLCTEIPEGIKLGDEISFLDSDNAAYDLIKL